jgi:hypothetical protein
VGTKRDTPGLEDHDTEVTRPGTFEDHDTEVMAPDHEQTFQDAPAVQVELDPEEQPIELWASAARSLFSDQLANKRTPEEQPLQLAQQPVRQQPPPAGPVIEPVHLDPIRPLTAERDATSVAGEITDQADTLDRPPPIPVSTPRAWAPEPDAEPDTGPDARLQKDSVEVYGAEALAARRLEQLEAMEQDEDATEVLEPPHSPRLNHACRICDRRITAPAPRRFRGPPDGLQGFRCDRCQNVFCAAHVVRSRGLLMSLLAGGRFRCLLCQEAPGG